EIRQSRRRRHLWLPRRQRIASLYWPNSIPSLFPCVTTVGHCAKGSLRWFELLLIPSLVKAGVYEAVWTRRRECQVKRCMPLQQCCITVCSAAIYRRYAHKLARRWQLSCEVLTDC